VAAFPFGRPTRTWAVVIALAAVAVVPAAALEASTLRATRVAYTTISVEHLAQMLGNKDFVLINVHIPYEGEIAQTDLFIPFDEIAARISELPPTSR
jgi:hypothetical protein